jgi:hypothetical protein
MNEEEVRKRAEEISRMSSEEFIRDRDLRRRDRKRDMDAITRKWFRSTFDEEFRSVDDVLNRLHADEPRLRRLALFAVLGPWCRSVGHSQDRRIEEMATADPDDNVRSAALIVLGSLFSGSRDRRIGALLAAVTLNEDEQFECRRSAYSGFLDLHGAPSGVGLPQFPETVDWELLRSYLRSES